MTPDHDCADRRRHRSDALERALSTDPFRHDVGKSSRLAVALCECVPDQLDPGQAAAVELARRFSAEADRAAHLQAVREFTARIDADLRAGRHDEAAARNQLVRAALDAHAGLSAYVADCLVGAAEEAGIEDEALDRVLAEHVPGFVPP